MLIGTKSDLKSSTEDEWNKLLRDNAIEQVDFKNPITIKEGIYCFKCSGKCVSVRYMNIREARPTHQNMFHQK